MNAKKEMPTDGWPDQQSDNRPFFVYDPGGYGFSYFATEQERDDAAHSVIRSYHDSEWDEEVTDVVAGTLTHKVTQTDVVQRPDNLDEDGCDEDGACWNDWLHTCNYKLLPLKPDKT